VDGTVVTELGARVVPGLQVVCVDGVRVQEAPTRWLAVNKPLGYLTSRRDDRGRPTVYALLPDGSGELFHVGRLDLLTEGLLVFTNDGETAHRLLHPSYEIPRRYRVEVEGVVDEATLRRLERGVELEDGLARAEDVQIVRPRRPGARKSTQILLTLREGRRREVRRLMEVLALPVKRLVRVSFGPIELGDLAPGKSRELTAAEIAALKAAVVQRVSNGDT
jgi:23S rRNA pseudouridine2605 synthase